jgi:hypothetical protein
MSIIHIKQAKKFVMIDYFDQYEQNLSLYHGKAITLNIADKHALPSISYCNDIMDSRQAPSLGIISFDDH